MNIEEKLESINMKLGSILIEHREQTQSLRDAIKSMVEEVKTINDDNNPIIELDTIKSMGELICILIQNNVNLRKAISIFENDDKDKKNWRDANEVLGP